MTLTIVLPRVAEEHLEAESERTGVPVNELATQMLLEHMKLDNAFIEKRIPRPGFASDLFEGIDIDALLSIPIPGIEEYMPQ